MKKICGIYRLVSPSGKSYIGQSRNIFARWSSHRRERRHDQVKLYNAIKKYSFDNFQKYILEECLIEHLDERERFWIKEFNSVNYGYNCDYGGQSNKVFSQEHIEKLRRANLGKYRGSQNMEFMIDGVLYFSVGQASKKLGIPPKTIHNRLNSKNENYSQYIYLDCAKIPTRAQRKTPSKGVTINSIHYPTYRKAAAELGIPATTLWRRFK